MRKTKEDRRQARIQQHLQRSIAFTKSLAKYVASGMPKASDDEIQRRFSICQTCQHFSGKSCRVCNCGINASQSLMNKLSWVDQHCPDNPRRW